MFPFLGSMGDINVGIVALLANVVVLVAVSLATRTSTATDKAGASPDLPCKLRADDVRDTDKRPLDTERKEPDQNANRFE
jgi:hypothetical protein